jgi:hypothetical protein
MLKPENKIEDGMIENLSGGGGGGGDEREKEEKD